MKRNVMQREERIQASAIADYLAAIGRDRRCQIDGQGNKLRNCPSTGVNHLQIFDSVKHLREYMNRHRVYT